MGWCFCDWEHVAELNEKPLKTSGVCGHCGSVQGGGSGLIEMKTSASHRGLVWGLIDLGMLCIARLAR